MDSKLTTRATFQICSPTDRVFSPCSKKLMQTGQRKPSRVVRSLNFDDAVNAPNRTRTSSLSKQTY